MGSEETAREAIADQATQWLVRLDAGRADPEAFEQWRSADARHSAIFAQLAATWTKTGELRAAGIDFSSRSLPSALELEEPHVQIGRRRLLGGLAAGIVAVAAVGTGALFWDRRAYAETGVGERRMVVLPDGNRVELNTHSRVAWQSGKLLELWLEQGEAAFLIARGAGQRVVARADGLSAVLMPGRFNLRLMETGIRLIALSGSAEITDRRDRTVKLASGQMLDDGPEGSSTRVLRPADMDQVSAWRQGEILFDGMTLAQAVGEFNRYLTRPIELADPALASIRLGGRFSTDDPQGFLQSLSEGFGIASQVADGRILLISGQSSG